MSLKFFKVITLPGVLEANALYFQYDATKPVDGLVVHMTNAAGSVARKVYGNPEATAAIAAAIESYDEAGAAKLAQEIEIAITGDATASAVTDGSGDVSLALTLTASGTAGTYAVVTTDDKGRVTSGRALTANDLPVELTSNTNGNAATATLADEASMVTNALTINGIDFDGSAAVNHDLVKTSDVGAALGVAALDANGRVPAGQLPSYVDDVIEVTGFGNLPVVGEAGKIYVVVNAEGKSKVYRWTGSTYIMINDAVSTSDTADSLATARNIAATGDVVWSVNFDGSANVTAAATLADVSTAGAQGGIVTTDSKGRVVSSRALALGDLPAGITATGIDFAEAPAW